MRLRSGVLAVAALAVMGTAHAVQACPMCSQSISSGVDNTIPRAYMYSILFMLATLGTILSAVIVGIYRAVKQHDAAQAALYADHGLFAESHHAPRVELEYATQA